MKIPDINQLKQRAGQFLNQNIVRPFQKADNFVQNTARNLGTAGVQVLSQGPGEALSRAYPSIARNVNFGTAVRLPEEILGNVFSGTKKFLNTSGNLIGEGLAYQEPNVRKQYLAGNTQILPTLTQTTLPQLWGQAGQTALEMLPTKYATSLFGNLTKPIPGKLRLQNPAIQKAVKNTLIGTAGGYAYDVASNFGNGVTGLSTLRPGMGTLIGGGLSSLPLIGAGLSSKEKLKGSIKNPFFQEAGKSMIEPSVNDYPLLSGRTPIAGVNDQIPSALQTSRQIFIGKNKSVMITGNPADLGGVTARIEKGRVQINSELFGVNAPYKDTPLLPAGDTPPMPLRLTSGVSAPRTFGDLEKSIYKYSAYEPTGQGKTGVGIIGNFNRKIENKIDDVVSNMLSSDNVVLRTIGNTLRGFAGGLGKNPELSKNIAQFHGQQDYASKIVMDLQRMISKKSHLKLLSHLDPALTGGITKILNATEKEQLATLKVVSDFINDTNYKNGFLTKEKWTSNRGGRYIARAYDFYDMPPEIADFVKQANTKFDLNPFKQRGALTDWKIEHSIKDPVYLLGKRLQQTLFNDATKKMFDWLPTQSQYVSNQPRGGYTQISEHPAYGSLSGKWVRKDIMESIRGLYFEHQWLQNAYDVLKAYDRNPVRRGIKKGMTVYNPPVRAGNVVGDVSFAHFNGLNPVTFSKRFAETPTLLGHNDPYVLRFTRDGILGSGTHKGDIVKYANELKTGVTDKNVLQKIDEIVSKSYGETDDRAKYVAMKMHLDNGVSYEEAAKRVMDGFQNFHTVGFLYDIGSKLPILGNPFVRFQASLMTILKTAARDHPIRALATGLLFTHFQDVMSRISGETTEDKKTRESRVGAPHIPFTNISLTVQTPWGEVNPARMIGIYSGNPVGGNSVSNDLSRVMPFKDPTDVRNYGSDPLVGPLISAGLTGVDFRGKNIADPNQTKYNPSTLTPSEKNWNITSYLQRAYTPPVINSGVDINNSFQGKPDFYGRIRNPLQAVSSATGVKIEQYGQKEANDRRIQDQVFAQRDKETIKRSVNLVIKEKQAGKIDSETAQARIDNLTSGLSQGVSINRTGDSRIDPNPMGGFNYTDANGDLKTVDTLQKAQENLFKRDFEASDKNIAEFNNKIFRKDEFGVAHPISKYKYNSQLLSAQMTGAQDNQDPQGWFNLAKQQYQNLTTQLQDPNIDQQEAQVVKNQVHDLIKKAVLIKKWGAFKKPKKMPKRKSIKLKTTFKTFLQTPKNTTKTIKKIQFQKPFFSVGKGYKVK